MFDMRWLYRAGAASCAAATLVACSSGTDSAESTQSPESAPASEAPAEPIAEPSGSRDDDRDGEQVADRDPLRLVRVHAEVDRHRRQRDGDHRAVDHRHEDREDVDDEYLPLVGQARETGDHGR